MPVVWCVADALGVRVSVVVIPNAKKTEVVGMHAEALKLRLQAPPIDGRANAALIMYLAKTLAIPKSCIRVLHGQSSKRKLLAIHHAGLTVEQVVSQLLPASDAVD
jgi:uncharacterized protein (TIGR00251 family)